MANPLHGLTLPSLTLFLPPRSAHVRLPLRLQLSAPVTGSHVPLPDRLRLLRLGFSWLNRSARHTPSDLQVSRTRCASLALTQSSRFSHVRLPANVTGFVRQTPNQLVRAASSAPSAVLILVYEYPNAPFRVRSVFPAALAVSFPPHFLGYRTCRESRGRSARVPHGRG